MSVGLSGQVKTHVTLCKEWGTETASDSLEIVESNLYSSDGRLLARGGTSGASSYSGSFIYDSEENLTRIDFYYDNSLYSKTVIHVDEKGQAIAFEDFNSEGLLDNKNTFVYEYDNKERISKLFAYDEDEILSYTETLTYDGQGNRSNLSEGFDEQGNLEDSMLQMNDANGQPLLLANYTNDGSLVYKETTLYDSYGNELEKSYFDENNQVIQKQIFTNTYDEENNVIHSIETIYDVSGSKETPSETRYCDYLIEYYK
jgi:hypothetical protein